MILNNIAQKKYISKEIKYNEIISEKDDFYKKWKTILNKSVKFLVL